MDRVRDTRRTLLIGFLLALSGAAVGLWWLCERSETIAFLPARKGAEWIVYPKPAEGGREVERPLSTVFQSSLNLETTPAQAVLTFSAFRSAAVVLNQQALPIRHSASAGWKSAQSLDVTGWLRTGTNWLTVWVTNATGPPALWLRLQAGPRSLATDEGWQASLAGSQWQPARLASRPPPNRPSDPLYGTESVLSSVKRIWPALLVCAAAALALVGSGAGVSPVARASRPRKQPAAAGETPAPLPDATAPHVGCYTSWMLRLGNRWPFPLLVVVLIARAALFIHNAPLLAPTTGFDSTAHAAYVQFILEKHALPLPSDGWEMFQPPFYYASSALLLSACGMSTTGDDAVLVMRALNGLVGLVHCWLALLCFRLLFPGNSRAQAAGLLLAAFIAPHLYLSQYISNEPLAGLFVTLSLYFSLRVLTGQSSGVVPHLAIGASLGAAMLTKTSALLALPFFPLALALPRIFPTMFGHESNQPKGAASGRSADFQSAVSPIFNRQGSRSSQDTPKSERRAECNSAIQQIENLRYGRKNCLRTLGALALACLAVCGWHYTRIWIHCGRPIVGNWESGWWQDPGFHTSSFFTGFGHSLISPIFCGFYSFADGIYSTLWGDGLASGAARLLARPPWNYDWMNAGYWLAVPLFLLLLIGFGITVARFIRQPRPEWFLMTGMLCSFGFGILYMSLRVPSYAQVKAFYGFAALVPLCALFALAWNWLERFHHALRGVMWIVLLVWALVSFGAFWVQSADPQTYLARGASLANAQRDSQAAQDLSLALQLDDAAPQSGQTPLSKLGKAEAHFSLGLVLERRGQSLEAVRHYREALRADGGFDGALNNLAWLLATDPDEHIRNGAEAVRLADQACALTHDEITIYIGTLAAAYAEAGDFVHAVAAAQKAIACARLRQEPELAERNQQLLELYKAGKPYREKL